MTEFSAKWALWSPPKVVKATYALPSAAGRHGRWFPPHCLFKRDFRLYPCRDPRGRRFRGRLRRCHIRLCARIDHHRLAVTWRLLPENQEPGLPVTGFGHQQKQAELRRGQVPIRPRPPVLIGLKPIVHSTVLFILQPRVFSHADDPPSVWKPHRACERR
jgi:hypothetical protein